MTPHLSLWHLPVERLKKIYVCKQYQRIIWDSFEVLKKKKKKESRRRVNGAAKEYHVMKCTTPFTPGRQPAGPCQHLLRITREATNFANYPKRSRAQVLVQFMTLLCTCAARCCKVLDSGCHKDFDHRNSGTEQVWAS